MLPMIIFVQVSLCNGQWPLQSIGGEASKLPPLPPSQPGYPYDEVPELIKISQKPNLPETPQPNNSTMLNDLKIPDEGSELATNNTFDQDWITARVRSMANNRRNIRNETDAFMRDFQSVYVHLGLDEADNEEKVENFYKYGMSVILRFLLEFYRMFKRLSSPQSSLPQLTNVDTYGLSYEEAVSTMKSKRNYSHLEIAVPIRRSADIFKSILYQSVEIVQTKCSAKQPNWQCLILYLANLISESINCPNIWYHAFIHMLTLEANSRRHHSFIYNIGDIIKFTDLPFENIFDYVMDLIVEFKEVGRIQWNMDAVLFTMIEDLQENGLLDCIYISDLYN